MYSILGAKTIPRCYLYTMHMRTGNKIRSDKCNVIMSRSNIFYNFVVPLEPYGARLSLTVFKSLTE